MSDTANTIYQLKISLLGISPMIWRRVLIPADTTLYGFHRVVQIVLGWEDYHLHAFHIHGRHYRTMWTGERHWENGHEIMLADLRFRLRQRILYEYDFGDLWVHVIRIEARLERQDRKFYPICVGGARAGPPEDIGGPEGYAAFVERLGFGKFAPWFGGDDDDEIDGYEDEDDPLRHFEPERFNRRDVNAELKREWAEQKADGAEELQEAHDRGRRWGPADAFWVCLSRTGEIAVL